MPPVTEGNNGPTVIPSRGGTSPIGTTSPNTGSTGNTNSTYAPDAFASGVNDQGAAAAYTVQDTDYQGIIIFDTASAIAITLNQAVGVNFQTTILNLSTGAITLTPDGGLTVNGASTLALASGQGVQVFFADGAWLAYAGSTIIQVVPQNTPGTAHEWLASYNSATGVFSLAAVDFTDLTGSIATSQLPANVPVVSFGSGSPSGSSTEGYEYFDTSASPAHGWVYHSGSWVQFS